MKRINLRSYNSKSIEIKKSLSISNDKLKQKIAGASGAIGENDDADLSMTDSDEKKSEKAEKGAAGPPNPVKAKNPGSPVSFARAGAPSNEQTLMQHIFGANPIQSKVISNNAAKGRQSVKQATVSKASAEAEEEKSK